jgi:hypothetical protein
MKPASVLVYSASLAAFAISMLMPATRDWLGLFWAAFALEVVLRGPQGAADYPLYLLVTAANLLALFSPIAFAQAARWGCILAHLLVMAVAGSAIASVFYRSATWAPGWYLWCVALGLMATAIYLNALANREPAGSNARPGRALHSLRRTGR